MRFRTFILITVLALIAAACGPSTGGSDPSSTEGQSDAITTTTDSPEAVISAPDAMLLSYKLVAGETYTYDVGIDQRIQMMAEGDSAALGDEEIPGEVAINLSGTTTFTHSVAEGLEPGTFEVTIKGDFTDLAVTGTVDGEPIEADLPDFAEMEAIDITIVVDEQGNIIPQDDEVGDIFGGDLGGLGSLGNFAGSGMTPGQFVGPPLSEEEVTVGDTWSETIELPGVMTEDPVTTEINSEVVGTDTVDGHEVLVIDTESVTSMIEFDLAQFLIGFFTAFVPEDGTAESDALVEDLRFLFTIDETVSNMTTWFDAETGYARMAELSSSTHFVMDINMPDDESGEMIGFVMDMSIAQDITYHLTDNSGA